jgi:hypothetical protein
MLHHVIGVFSIRRERVSFNGDHAQRAVGESDGTSLSASAVYLPDARASTISAAVSRTPFASAPIARFHDAVHHLPRGRIRWAAVQVP